MHPSEQKRTDIKRSQSTDHALISSGLVGHREVFPKFLENEIHLEGAAPGLVYNVVNSNPIPQDHVFHVTHVTERMTAYDPPAGFPENFLGTFYLLADGVPFWCSALIQGGLTRVAPFGGFDADRAHPLQKYYLDYYISYDTILSIFACFFYAGGAAGPPPTEADYNVTMCGELIYKPTDMARGQQVVVPGTFAQWILTVARYLL